MVYHYKTGVVVPFAQKYFKLVTLAVAGLFLATVAAATLGANAMGQSVWKAVAGSQINFSCGGGSYLHTLDTVVQGSSGNFTGTGHYNPDASYTWNLNGNITGNTFTFTILYTGSAPDSVYNATAGLIAPDGSATATVDSNCQSLTMPAGSFVKSKLRKKEIDVRGNTGVENQKGAWMFNRDPSTATPFEFTTAQKSLHKGSLYVKPIGSNPSDKFIGEFFAKTEISKVSSFSYDFKVGTGGNQLTDADQFYLNVYANFGSSSPDKYYDCRYDVVPTTSNGWTTVTFDPTVAYPVTTRTKAGQESPYPCPAKPADMDLLSVGSTFRMFAINLGDTNANDLGLDGYFDKVVFTTSTKVTTYDFEPAKHHKDECKKDGWRNMRDDDDKKFKNQGDCVSYHEHQEHNDSHHRRDDD